MRKLEAVVREEAVEGEHMTAARENSRHSERPPKEAGTPSPRLRLVEPPAPMGTPPVTQPDFLGHNLVKAGGSAGNTAEVAMV